MNVIVTILIIALIGLFIGAFVSGLNKSNSNSSRSLNGKLIDKNHSCNYPKQGYARVNIESFQKKHKLMPIELFEELLDWDNEIVYIEASIYKATIDATKSRDLKDWALSTYYGLINGAKDSEKEGDVEKSIALYENTLEFAKKNSLKIHNYAHCIDRLLVLYRKKKDRESEKSLLNYALETHSDFNNPTYDKWNERLAKLI